MTTTLESLPNELCLLFMRFLAPIDLYRALVDLNYRINSLLTAMIPHPILDTSQCASSRILFSDFCQLLEGKHYWSKCLLPAIDTIHLGDTLAGKILCDDSKSPFTLSSMNTSLSNLFTSLCRLYITEEVINQTNILQMLLPMRNSLRHLHLTFGDSVHDSLYTKIINEFIHHKLSFYSMIFDINNGPHDHDWNINKCQWQDLYWPNTVHLSLSIQQASDLFLLHHRALPILDHLCVTIFKPVKCFTKVIENDLELKNTTNMMIFRLRSLQLSHISLAQLLIYLSSIYMPLLEKLTLTDVYDNTLNHLNQFQQYFQSKTNMPALQPSSFKFLLRFPSEFEYEWKINRNYEWPFETTNIDYCLEEYRLSFLQYWRERLEPPIPK
ncbi:unnamed protein product [Adineta steineri]|uniref:F-box domain-containing protein n=2 Tax=Adineta steineri TaxID=433720 RepID=A0A814LW11_9BILA|nr:unnamed protein product [Adineta steineri]